MCTLLFSNTITSCSFSATCGQLKHSPLVGVIRKEWFRCCNYAGCCCVVDIAICWKQADVWEHDVCEIWCGIVRVFSAACEPGLAFAELALRSANLTPLRSRSPPTRHRSGPWERFTFILSQKRVWVCVLFANMPVLSLIKWSIKLFELTFPFNDNNLSLSCSSLLERGIDINQRSWVKVQTLGWQMTYLIRQLNSPGTSLLHWFLFFKSILCSVLT